MINNIIRSARPYHSSTIYHVTASLYSDFSEMNIFEKVQKARPIVFPFDYPTPKNIDTNDFKDYFETLFISRYIDDYFKFETFERFEIALYSKMLEVLPPYCQMLSNFFSENEKDFFLNIEESETESNSKSNSDNSGSGTEKSDSTVKADGTNQSISSQFPQNIKNAGKKIDNVNYANDGSLTESENNSKTDVNRKTTNQNSSNNNSESNTKFKRKSGNMFEMMMKYDEHFNKIFTKLMNEFNPLFSAVINL